MIKNKKDTDFDALNEADKHLKDALSKRIIAGNEAARVALHNLVNWIPEDGYHSEWPMVYADGYSKKEKTEQRAEVNKNCPFATEAFTYELFGKEDARTFLGLLSSLARALGFEGLYDLQRDVDDK